jgi:hypothetical protein
VRAGALFSSFGTFLLVLFIVIILFFPVEKDCSKYESCKFYSTAPEPFNYLISPAFIVIALSVISAGVLVMRVAKWYSYRT